MAIIIDKNEKRKQIAFSCKELLFQNGIKNITVSQIATEAGIGKGTVYEYFSSKDEIVFEILNILVEDMQKWFEEFFDEQKFNFEDKLRYFLSFLFLPEYENNLKIYKEFLSIAITEASNEMKEHDKECVSSFEKFLGKMIEEAIILEKLDLTNDVIRIIRFFHLGLVVRSSLDDLGVEEEIEKFIAFIMHRGGSN
ncbi:MAG: TetR/AcrR family transcriptional regulator [Sulfurovaceae bacterium]|nr:TetR/AcrR family transcriptional regulator [Sulfurovaceae bacterium]MDD5548564.1 TetR/AcrR family transcriptional regulator [Sulfurovaceae bacterium]